MLNNAYWILPTGQILKPSTYHIGSVIKHPEKFGMTTKEIKEIYDKYKEPVSPTAEGKSREFIMERLLRKGFIRIRENKNGSYTIQLNKLSQKIGDVLWEWANKESQSANDKFADVTIHQLMGNKMQRTSLDRISSGESIIESTGRRLLTPEECANIRVYNEDDMNELPDYFDYAEDIIDEHTEQWVIDEILCNTHDVMMRHIQSIRK